jgi:integrase
MARREWQDPPIHERRGAQGLEYFIRYRVKVLEIDGGRPKIRKRGKFEVLGPVTMGRRGAERKKAEIMRSVNGQVYTIQSQIPFESFLKIWKDEHYRGLKETSRRYYDQRIAAWIEPTFTGRKLGQITALDVGQMFGAMEAANVARTTRTATRAILRKMFSCAKRWGYLKDVDNPAACAEIGRSAGAARVQWTPSMEEAQAIIAAADPEVGLMLESIVWTGMRVSELLGVRCNSVDLDHATVKVVVRNCRYDTDTPKSAAGIRELPLGHLVTRFAGLIGTSEDYVFRDNAGQPYTDQRLHRRLHAALDAAGHGGHVGNAWHAFRRLHLTLMSTRMSLFDLRAQAGHAQLSTTQKYVAPSLVNRTAAVTAAQDNVVPITSAIERKAAG